MEALRHIDYEAYFNYVVSQHPSFTLDAGEEIFGMAEIEESYGQLKSKVKIGGYFFRLFRYMYRSGQPLGQQNVDKNIFAGWFIGKMISVKSSTAAEREQALADVERINDDFIERLIADSRNGHPTFCHSLDTDHDFATSFTLNAGDGSFVGCRTTFSFQHYIPVCLNRDGATAWIDGGLTPNVIP